MPKGTKVNQVIQILLTPSNHRTVILGLIILLKRVHELYWLLSMNPMPRINFNKIPLKINLRKQLLIRVQFIHPNVITPRPSHQKNPPSLLPRPSPISPPQIISITSHQPLIVHPPPPICYLLPS